MKKGILPRILLSLLGAAFILYGVSHLVLGVFGETATAVITGIRREGGERADSKPNRYTYNISYSFALPDGKKIDGSTKKISDSIYLKPDGTSTKIVRYFKFAPFINALEEDTKLTFGQPIIIAAGAFLIVVMNRTKINFIRKNQNDKNIDH